MRDCNSARAPFPSSAKFHPSTKEDEFFPDFQINFPIHVVQIRYLVDSTLPYLFYAAFVLGVELQNTTTIHRQLPQTVTRYNKGTLIFGLHYPKSTNPYSEL